MPSTAPRTGADPAAELLGLAADTITRCGLARGRLGNESDGFCALGALSHAFNRIYDVPSAAAHDAYERAARRVYDAIFPRAIIDWNDDPCTSRDEVIRVLRDAAAATAPSVPSAPSAPSAQTPTPTPTPTPEAT